MRFIVTFTLTLSCVAQWLSTCDIQHCSSHGTCSPSGGCICFNDQPLPTGGPIEYLGHWTGPTCSTCVQGWMPLPGTGGPACVQMCTPQICYGHGLCDAPRLMCVCYNNSADGYWSPATNCSTCASGWTGPSCVARAIVPLPSPVLVPSKAESAPRSQMCTVSSCGGHGVCDSIGQCVCYDSDVDGHFAGEKCTSCSSGWYPATGVGACTRECGSSVCVQSLYGFPVCSSSGECVCGPNSTCGGHGICAYTEKGPRCLCNQSPTSGFWNYQSNCTTCLVGYGGSACGALDTAINKTAGELPKEAPCANNTDCSGHGVCELAVCICIAHWSAAAGCAACEEGWEGAECNMQSAQTASHSGSLGLFIGLPIGIAFLTGLATAFCCWKTRKASAREDSPSVGGVSPVPRFAYPPAGDGTLQEYGMVKHTYVDPFPAINALYDRGSTQNHKSSTQLTYYQPDTLKDTQEALMKVGFNPSPRAQYPHFQRDSQEAIISPAFVNPPPFIAHPPNRQPVKTLP